MSVDISELGKYKGKKSLFLTKARHHRHSQIIHGQLVLAQVHSKDTAPEENKNVIRKVDATLMSSAKP